MRDSIVVAGHTNVKGLDQGASANGYTEGQLAVEFRDLLIKELELCIKFFSYWVLDFGG